jgi:hypothetical protein
MKTKLFFTTILLFGLFINSYAQRANNQGYNKYWKKNRIFKPTGGSMNIGEEYTNPNNGKKICITTKSRSSL